MGQRQNQDEIIYGDDCLSLFPAGKTPKYVYMRFSMVKKCTKAFCEGAPSPPNDRVFKLTQEPWDPCWWALHGDWEVAWQLRPGPPTTIEFRLNYQPLFLWYFDSLYYPESRDPMTTHNALSCADNWVCGHGGIATVTWLLESLKIMKALNIEPAYDLFMEMRPLVDGNKVYKYCKLKDATNIAIEFEPD